MKHYKIALFSLIWISCFWVLMAISPLDRNDWLMENILFFIFLAVLIGTYRKFQFSNLSYILITIFFTFHLIGAHYTYAKIPFGFYLSEVFNFERNHADRLVHFLFGLLITFPMREILIRKTQTHGFLSYFIPVNVALAFGAFFEIVEWQFVLLVNPELGIAYLGTQGDIWDAQQDMILALTGATLAMLITYLIEKRKS